MLLYPLTEIRQFFKLQKGSSSHFNAHACLFPPRHAGSLYRHSVGGLFISVRAFGDASVKIDRTLLHVFFIFTHMLSPAEHLVVSRFNMKNHTEYSGHKNGCRIVNKTEQDRTQHQFLLPCLIICCLTISITYFVKNVNGFYDFTSGNAIGLINSSSERRSKGIITNLGEAIVNTKLGNIFLFQFAKNGERIDP